MNTFYCLKRKINIETEQTQVNDLYNMEHLRTVMQKLRNKKNYFQKETFADGVFRAFAVFGCNFIQKMLSAESLRAPNFSKLVIRESFRPENDERFSKFSTYLSYFFKFSEWFIICCKL